jgi:branched-chain amino acid transport system ATP-binding protein
MALFEARRVHKRFGHQVVLENVDLEFEAHRLSGIVGPNGAGKTTLFNVMTGRYKPDRGKVIFDGEDITGLPEHVIAKKGISRSFQLINVFDEFTALQNVTVALPEVRECCFNTWRNVPTDEEILRKAYKVLEQVNLLDVADTDAENLSYGQRRALEIGIALATRPKMLFLDEPTQGLGGEQIDGLIELIERLKEQLTIVIIEHDMRFLFHLADVIYVVHWGQVISKGTPEELKRNKWVRASQLGQLT